MGKACGTPAAASWLIGQVPGLGSLTASLGRPWRLHAARAIRPRDEGPWVTLVGRWAFQMVSLPEIVVSGPVAVKQFVHMGGGEQQAAALSVTSHLRWAVATFFAEIVEVIDELLALHSQGVARRHRGHTQSLAPLSVIHYCHHPIGRQISPEMPTPPCLVVALQLSSAAEPVRRGM